MVRQLDTNVQPDFTAQTIINSLPDGIQIIVQTAPQVSMVVVISLAQLQEAMKNCMQLRTGGRKLESV